ncbi:MAG: hypothetical protein ACI8UR_000856 [Natronomonas sp.]|uniref:hypothetical protein n=1 Tax=Natronomonas sp. TaxID=2184060 RepID=UPI00398A3554
MRAALLAALSPAALASALARPQTDLRDWDRSVAVMDILPPAEPEVVDGAVPPPYPPTAERVEYLRNLVETAETAG